MSPRQRKLAALPTPIANAAPADMTWLVGAEREFPFELPELPELTRWYLFSMGALVAAGLLAGIVHGIWRICRGRWSLLPASIAFWGSLLAFGVAATPLGNRYWSQFIFTWPLSLIGAHQIALAAVTWSKQPGRSKAADWVGVAGACFLVLACLLYFKLTRQLSIAPAWYFLVTLPAAWPIAIPAARRLGRPGSLARDVLWMIAVFAVYFWVCAAVMLIRTAWHSASHQL